MVIGELEQETLAWVNEVRSVLGLGEIDRLPRGNPCDPRGCPLGRALEATVTHDGRALLSGAGIELRLPAAAREFASAYDVGAFPELELDTGHPLLA